MRTKDTREIYSVTCSWIKQNLRQMSRFSYVNFLSLKDLILTRFLNIAIYIFIFFKICIFLNVMFSGFSIFQSYIYLENKNLKKYKNLEQEYISKRANKITC